MASNARGAVKDRLEHDNEAPQARPSWGAVYALAVCAFALIASEFMPVSLLTPIASDLRITEGMAGQGIAISGVFAVLTSLFISSLAGGLDRKPLLLALTVAMGASGAIVALAPNYVTYMLGRALIGVVVGGFWSLSAATAIQLVPPRQVPRALAIVNGGNALATVVAAPLGAYLGAVVGWRGAFLGLAPIALIALAWQWITLPSLPAAARSPRAAMCSRHSGCSSAGESPWACWPAACCSWGNSRCLPMCVRSWRRSPGCMAPRFRSFCWPSARRVSLAPCSSAGCCNGASIRR
ncbi:MFS transporter [Achromobacter denitrificans]